jgi:3-dehydroquinate synthase
VDTNTHQHCLGNFIQGMEAFDNVEILEVEPGEATKDIEIAMNLWLSLAELSADRKALVLNLGGGVVCDLGGWVAANYKRGIDFIHLPTSLLAMVDASIGGKTGIDLGGIKNLVGSFSSPVAVVSHTPFLKTLPQREWDSGYAEMIKHALVADKDLWMQLRQSTPHEHEKIESHIPNAIQIKRDIVFADFEEKGLRKMLNYGHTIGHAIESISIERGENLSHGHAIAIGMMLANIISSKKEFLSKRVKDEINDYLKSIYSIPTWLTSVKSELDNKIANDKKNSENRILMVLLKDVASVEIDVEVSNLEIDEAIVALLTMS